MNHHVIAYALSLLLSWAPFKATKASDETEAERCARFREIAVAATSVAYSHEERPLFAGDKGRGRTLSLMLSVAFFESGFRRDVDLGEGKLARGEGVDSCLMQIRVGKGTTFEGWSHDDLVKDRTKCFKAGLRVMRGSFAMCRTSPIGDRLSAFTRGHCAEDKGSRLRVGLAMRSALVPVSDSEVLGEKAGGS